MQTTIFRIEVDPNLIPDEDLTALLEALSDFEPVLEDFGREMAAGEKDAFAAQGAPYGDVWQGLAPSTYRERLRQGFGDNPPLVRSGALRDAIGQTVSLSPNGVQVGVDTGLLPYANYLQGGTSRMPARLLVAISDDMIDAMMQTLRTYLANATGGNLDGISIVAETS